MTRVQCLIMNKNVLDIDNREADFYLIDKQSLRAEQGVRAICVMYDDHSSDKNSREKIFLLKDNVHYRLFSLKHQYLIFLRELSFAENYLQELDQKDPNLLNSIIYKNPYFEQIDLEISSVFDNIIFQLVSVYDYLSHLICYICKTDKSKTVYWTKLAKLVHGKDNEFTNLNIRKVIAELDNKIVGRLYDYRSRLIHNKRDQHTFNVSQKFIDLKFSLKIRASDLALKHFKTIREEYPNGEITLAFLASWLIKRCFIDIEMILDALRVEIINTSQLHQNLMNPKRNGFMFVSVDPKTKFAKPVSDGLWEQYKEMK